MREYKVNNIYHRIFEERKEVPPNIIIRENWREADVGDWVIADDGCVIQVLRKGSMLRTKGKIRKKYYIGTCTGTYPVTKSSKLDTSRRDNIYTFSGLLEPEKRGLTRKERMFIFYLSQEKLTPEQAYLKAFPTNNKRYASEKAASLIKTERITTAVKEELKPILDELGISDLYILKGIKDEAELAEKSDTRLKALFKLSDILDLEDKNQTKVTQIQGVAFGGFDEKMIETAIRPKEIEDGKK
jgi:hypothetical protein